MSNRTRYSCANCGYGENIQPPRLGNSTDEVARVAGWRLGTTGGGEGVAYCPECTGVDEDYWDRRTLATAYAAGIDAGNPAWGVGRGAVKRAERLRWRIAELIGRLPGQCWAEVADWPLGRRRVPWAPSGAACRTSAAKCGACWCGKYRTPDGAE